MLPTTNWEFGAVWRFLIERLILLILMYFYIWRFLNNKKLHTKTETNATKLPIALFFFLVSFIPSHGFPIWGNLIFASTIIIGRNEKDAIEKV